MFSFYVARMLYIMEICHYYIQIATVLSPIQLTELLSWTIKVKSPLPSYYMRSVNMS